MLSYLLLFFSAFLSATLFPFYSEAFLVVLIQQGKNLWLLFLFAIVGNTLGAVVNWFLGRYLLRFQDRSWFPFQETSIQKAQAWYQRYGVWSLLFSWLPIFGDGLTFIAGMMRIHIGLFLLLTAIGKGLRYGFVILLTLGLLH